MCVRRHLDPDSAISENAPVSSRTGSPGLLAAPTATFRIPRELSRRDATHRECEASKWRGASFGYSVSGAEETEGGGTLSPVKLRNIPREILQPVRAGSSGTIPHLAGAERPRHIANNEDRWRGLWRPDTVPRLLIGRINQRFHPAASRFSPLSSCRFSLFVSRNERETSPDLRRALDLYFRRWWRFWRVFPSLVMS